MTYFWIFVILFFSAIAFYTKTIPNKFDPRRLIFWVFLVFVVIPSFLILVVNISPFLFIDNIESTFVQVILFFMVFLATSELLARIRPIRADLLRVNLNDKVYIIAAVCMGISILAKIYLYQKGLFFIEDENDKSLVKIPAYIDYFKNIYLFGLLFLVTYALRKWCELNLIQKGTIVVYVLTVVSIEFAQGRRTGAVLPFAMIFTLWAIENRVKISSLFILGISGIVIFMATTIYRINQVLFISDDGGGLASSLFSNMDSSMLKTYFETFFAGALSRVGNPVIMVDRLITQAPTLGPVPFDSFPLVVQALIPRMFYPSKPSLSIGNEYGRYIGEIAPTNYEVGINPGWIAEGFVQNFSLSGVAIAAILFSFCSMLSYKICDPKTDLGKVLLWQMTIFLFSGFQLEIAFTVNNLVKGVLLNVFLFQLIAYFSRK
ncbi:MAG: hypothetical protein JJ909_04760 [Roseivirga sp.]|uniref:hypothetical protein n=1 Tax=Roseivirga sp. TaxID=1964215 RepID=UPI001B247CB7|nr:hypothetical protein [Roseivirga sp.]MBO6660982.1 hypothetical protein [Roseivirga sp.]MBO6760272.1 hypothetical protein [Roseivirga sp.]MBO6909034.1 hypothetical protein [Roseivirga sp.]